MRNGKIDIGEYEINRVSNHPTLGNEIFSSC